MRIALVLAADLVLLVGCQHFEHARQCRALADSVNPELKEMATVFDRRSPATEGEYKEAANTYVTLSKRLRSLKPKDPDLLRLAAELSDNFEMLSRTCNQLARRFAYPDKTADTAAERDLENQRQRHLSTVSNIDRICQEQ